MIQLTLVNDTGEALAFGAAPFFRITGGAVWTVPGDGHIARLTNGGWEAHGKRWTGMRFEGACRLVMGLPREPSSVSEILQSVSVSFDVLSVNGVPFAAYHAAQDIWHAAMADKWWHAFRIESVRHRMFNELERRRSETGYVKTADGFEVDFLARYRDAGEELIQVCTHLQSEDTVAREVRALEAAATEHPRAHQPILVR